MKDYDKKQVILLTLFLFVLIGFILFIGGYLL